MCRGRPIMLTLKDNFPIKMCENPKTGTVSYSPRSRKDIIMKLFCVLAVLLAISLANEIQKEHNFDDSQATASVGLQKHEELNPVPTHDKPRRKLKRRVIRPRYYGSSNPNPNPPENNYNQPQNNYNQPQNNYNPPQNNYNQPQNNYNPPQNNYNQPQNNYNQPQNNYNPPQNNYNNPQNNYNQPQNTYPQNQNQNQNNWWEQNTWNNPNYNQNNNWNNQATTTTTQAPWTTWSQAPSITSTTTESVAVIKNEQTIGENGSYKYEYQIADGTHVYEEGYVLNPNTENEITVKKGMYSYTGADGKVYTIKYWADDTGYHAEGDHLPKAPPVPPEIQASIDQNAKEEAAKAEAEKNKGQGYPQAQQPPKPIKPPTQIQPQPQPAYPQQSYNPQQNYPAQPTYPTQQQNYPSQQTNYPSQQYPTQQQNYPSQQYPSQQQNYPTQNPSYGTQGQANPDQNNFYPPLSYGK